MKPRWAVREGFIKKWEIPSSGKFSQLFLMNPSLNIRIEHWRCKQYFPVYFGETVFIIFSVFKEHFCTEEFWWHLQNISVTYTLYSILSLCLHTGGGPKPTTTPPVTPLTTSPVITNCGKLSKWMITTKKQHTFIWEDFTTFILSTIHFCFFHLRRLEDFPLFLSFCCRY